jgi:hypothetical protein
MTAGSDPPRLFGRYHEIMLLLIGTLCGTVLGTYLQHMSWRYQHDENLRQAERLTAEQTAGTVSRLIDSRMYRMRRVLWGYRGKVERGELKARWDAYQECLDQWNGSLNGTLAGLDRHFGTPVRTVFEQEVHAGLRWIGGRMERLRGVRRTAAGTADTLLLELDRLNTAAYEFNGRLLDAVQRGDVGQFVPAGR